MFTDDLLYTNEYSSTSIKDVASTKKSKEDFNKYIKSRTNLDEKYPTVGGGKFNKNKVYDYFKLKK